MGVCIEPGGNPYEGRVDHSEVAHGNEDHPEERECWLCGECSPAAFCGDLALALSRRRCRRPLHGCLFVSGCVAMVSIDSREEKSLPGDSPRFKVNEAVKVMRTASFSLIDRSTSN